MIEGVKTARAAEVDIDAPGSAGSADDDVGEPVAVQIPRAHGLERVPDPARALRWSE